MVRRSQGSHEDGRMAEEGAAKFAMQMQMNGCDFASMNTELLLAMRTTLSYGHLNMSLRCKISELAYWINTPAHYHDATSNV